MFLVQGEGDGKVHVIGVHSAPMSHHSGGLWVPGLQILEEGKVAMHQ